MEQGVAFPPTLTQAGAALGHLRVRPQPPSPGHPSVGGSACHRGALPEPWGTPGRGARVAAGGAAQSWGPRPAALGFARESDAAAQPRLASTQPRVFQKGSSREKKKKEFSEGSAKPSARSSALPLPRAQVPPPRAQLAELRTGRSRPQMPRPARDGPG